jgi:hypothetical protein
MFQMNKQLAKHIWPLVQEDEAGTTNDPEKGKQKMKMETDEGTDIHFFNLFMLLSQGEYKIIHLLKLYR